MPRPIKITSRTNSVLVEFLSEQNKLRDKTTIRIDSVKDLDSYPGDGTEKEPSKVVMRRNSGSLSLYYEHVEVDGVEPESHEEFYTILDAIMS